MITYHVLNKVCNTRIFTIVLFTVFQNLPNSVDNNVYLAVKQCTLEILLMIGYIKVNFGENIKIFSFILGSNGPN